MSASRREFVIAAGALGLASATRQAGAAAGEQLTPEMFGAKGDGRTNDTDAFAALSAHVNARGGGTIVLRPVTYIVGKQSPGGPGQKAFVPVDIIHLKNCTGPITIRGNGAILRCASGLRYGGFDRVTGKPLPDARENLKKENRAEPYWSMIQVQRSSGSIEISDIELDGNLAGMIVGGKYDPRGGMQAGGSGIRLIRNTGPERVSRIRSHHHPQDGMIFKSDINRSNSTVVSDAICDENGRCGGSVLAGANYSFERCRFRRTGRAGIHSSPAAGVDIEAEGSPISNVNFADCEFSDNHGFGLVAGNAKSQKATFTRCKFIGTRNYAAWPHGAGFRFTDCLFVGQIVNVFGDEDPARAAQFVNCIFADDPTLSPTREVFLGRAGPSTIAVLLKSQNVLFSHCHFRLVANGLLPQSRSDVIYADCDMSQRSREPSAPVGTYVGTNTISGNARLEGSVIRGTVTLNGRTVPRNA